MRNLYLVRSLVFHAPLLILFMVATEESQNRIGDLATAFLLGAACVFYRNHLMFEGWKRERK